MKCVLRSHITINERDSNKYNHTTSLNIQPAFVTILMKLYPITRSEIQFCICHLNWLPLIKKIAAKNVNYLHLNQVTISHLLPVDPYCMHTKLATCMNKIHILRLYTLYVVNTCILLQYINP